MDALRHWFILTLFITLQSCQMGYLFQTAKGQISLMNRRIPIEDALKLEKLSETERIKLLLAQEARVFAENHLHLKPTKNYTSFVQLDQPYVTYVVSASPKWQLSHHLWSFPIIGKVPYKGFFKDNDARDEENLLKKQNLDTYRRGVSAYSTLGWFNDPILSSMLNYSNYEIVNLIIHETVHSTLYIKSNANFNEQLATFLGNKGAEQFYRQKEGPESPTLKTVIEENQDERIFSQFISTEIKLLEQWYKENTGQDESKRLERIKQIQTKFSNEILKQMKAKSYSRFSELELNNAKLLVYKTYLQDLSHFETLYQQVGGDFQKFIHKCTLLEKEKDPETAFKKMIEVTK